jgi:hypothetical protein
LASSTSGILVLDDGTGIGNNPERETISKLVVDLPADSLVETYLLQGPFVPLSPGTPLSGIRSAQVEFDAVNRRYVITSTILTNVADPALVTQSDREQAEQDIRDTLATFNVTIGPTHTDENGSLEVTVTTLDVKGGSSNTRDTTFRPIRVQAVADTPTVTVVNPAPTGVIDGPNIPLDITVGHSADRDNSETLSVVITVPKDGGVLIGTLVGTPPSGVTMQEVGVNTGVYVVNATGATWSIRESLLNSFLQASSGGTLALDPAAGYAGERLGPLGIRVDVISTEFATGTELAPGSFGGPDGTSKTETVTAFIGIRVTAEPSSSPSGAPSSSPIAGLALLAVPNNSTIFEDNRSPVLSPFVVNVPAGLPANEQPFLGKEAIEIRVWDYGDVTAVARILGRHSPDAFRCFVLLPLSGDCRN